MRFALFVKEEAQLDIHNSYTWYEEKLNGLGDRFIDALEDCIEGISKNPFMNQVRKYDVRYGFMDIFPYVVVYEVEEDTVIIYAVFNTHRNPSRLKKRTKK